MKTYQIYVDIAGVDPSRRDEVIQACCTHSGLGKMSFQEIANDPNRLTAMGHVQLEPADEGFIDRLAQATWGANKAGAIIAVFAVCLNDLPLFIRDRVDFAAWRKEQKSKVIEQ